MKKFAFALLNLPCICLAHVEYYYPDDYFNYPSEYSHPLDCSEPIYSEDVPPVRAFQEYEEEPTSVNFARVYESKQAPVIDQIENELIGKSEADLLRDLNLDQRFTANVSLVSDYRFRGISQTMRRPAIQGGFDYVNSNGFYVGTWASNVDGTTHFYNNTSMEWDFYGGFRGQPFSCAIPAFSFNIGAIYYYYPGGQTKTCHNTKYNTAECYIELSYACLSIKYSISLTNYFGITSHNTPFNWETRKFLRPNGNSRGSHYVEANFDYDLLHTVRFRTFVGGRLNLFMHVGYLTVRHYGKLNYIDWTATVTQDLPWFSIFVSYVGTNAKHAFRDIPDNAYNPSKRSLGAQGVVFGVRRTF